jgi:competence protein ComEA
VTGAVEHPGVIQIAPGSIVEDALAMVGGTTENADLSRLNLARELSDGQQVFVPAIDAGSSPPGTQSTHALILEKININRADEVELEKLPGIGPSLAANIVEYRQEHGWFQELDELLDVSGIGPAKLDQIDDLITFH